MPAGRRWLDVGCGTGALCAAIADACAPSSLIGVDARCRLREHLRGQLPTHADGSIHLIARAWSVRGSLPK
jgi:precorrin-6B methylase 2